MTVKHSLAAVLDEGLRRHTEGIADCGSLGVQTSQANTISRGAAQSMAQALAAFVGLVVQYKVWRRLKDNKTLLAAWLACFPVPTAQGRKICECFNACGFLG